MTKCHQFARRSQTCSDKQPQFKEQHLGSAHPRRAVWRALGHRGGRATVDEPTPEGQVPSVTPATRPAPPWAPGTCWLHPLLPRHTLVTGGGGRQASTEGQGTGMGRRGHNRVGKSPGRAGPSPHHSLLPAVSKGGRQGWVGHEGLAVNASGRCWSLGLRLSQSQLRAQGDGALKAWVRQRGGIQLSDPRTASLLSP